MKTELRLTQLELAVLNNLLERTLEHADTLRGQLACAVVVSRELTGVGFFTHFTIPSTANVKRDLPEMYVSGTDADIEGLQNGAGFILFVRDGAISFLEGFSYGEAWNDMLAKFTIRTGNT